MSDLHPDQASPARAEVAWAFLLDLGFLLRERWISGGSSFRDGWRLVYSGPVVTVTLQYLDNQLEVVFARDSVSADYLLLDRELFGWRSGLHGDMFPPDQVGEVIDRTAADVRNNFGAILSGSPAEWVRIGRLLETPRRTPRLP